MIRTFLSYVKTSLDQSFFRSQIRTVFLLFLAAAALLTVVYHEMILDQKVSFLLAGDYIVDYTSTFVLTNFLYQGHIPLWDFFGQIPSTFFYTTYGVFKFPNLMTALVYYTAAFFSDHPAELFPRVFAVVYILSLLFIRVVGIFLLLGTVTKNRSIVAVGTVLFSVFFSPAGFIIGTFYQSFHPLLIFFILKFFTDFKPFYLASALLFLAISFSQGFIHTAYLYLSMHFFILSCLAWAIVVKRPQLISFGKDFFRRIQKDRMKAAGLIVVILLILAPYLYIQATCLKDIEFNASDSRISQMWDLQHYFKSLAINLAVPSRLFPNMLDFTQDVGESFFLGYTIFFLMIFGLAFHKDSRKWIFLSTIVCLWMLNNPKDVISAGSIVHWVNVLTNPLKAVVRSYHMATHAALPYLFMPLVVFGFEALENAPSIKFDSGNIRKLAGVVLCMIVLAVASMGFFPTITKIYIGTACCAGLLLLWIAIIKHKDPFWKRLGLGILACLIAVDISLVVHQTKHYFERYASLQPQLIDSQPNLGLMMVDIQNPKIFPFVRYFAFAHSFKDPGLWSLRGTSGVLFHVLNLRLNFLPAEGHSPRHSSFGGWPNDPAMSEYLSHNHQIMFFAPTAVAASDEMLDRINARGLQKDVVMIADAPSGANVLSAIPAETAKAKDDIVWNYMSGDLADLPFRLKDQMIEFSIALPPQVPSYLATTVFSDDRDMLQFFIEMPDKKRYMFEPAQGPLIRPFTFDVQNIKEGRLTGRISQEMFRSGIKYAFVFAGEGSNNIMHIGEHRSGRLEMTYRCPSDGWLVLHYPYDRKWRITVDRVPSAFYRANKSFIGVPVSKGDHRIVIEYWPGSWLPLGLLISAILANGGLLALIAAALKKRTGEIKAGG